MFFAFVFKIACKILLTAQPQSKTHKVITQDTFINEIGNTKQNGSHASQENTSNEAELHIFEVEEHGGEGSYDAHYVE